MAKETVVGFMTSVATSLEQRRDICTVSASIYDTAWVAMVEKHVDGKSTFLFPECFQFILDSQLPDGAWESYSSHTDGILNTMAALLALKKRCSTASFPWKLELFSRISKATAAAQRLLKDWDINSSDTVGYEVIVPALLGLLQEQGIDFDFPCRESLLLIHNHKMAKLHPFLVENESTSLVHSLEAFAGKLNYAKSKRHMSPYGDMMASPASTAAYLIFSPTWDVEAEQYLRAVVNSASAGQGTGRVPNVYPTTVFEVCWVRKKYTFDAEKAF